MPESFFMSSGSKPGCVAKTSAGLVVANILTAEAPAPPPWTPSLHSNGALTLSCGEFAFCLYPISASSVVRDDARSRGGSGSQHALALGAEVRTRIKRDAPAKRFFRKTMLAPHTQSLWVINVDKNAAYPKAIDEMKAESELSVSVELRQNKYLNNRIELSASIYQTIDSSGDGISLVQHSSGVH